MKRKHDNCSQGREKNDRNKQLSGEEERKGCHRSKVTQRAKRTLTSAETPQVFWVKSQTDRKSVHHEADLAFVMMRNPILLSL